MRPLKHRAGALAPLSPLNISLQDSKITRVRLRRREGTDSELQDQPKRHWDAAIMVIDDELSVLDLFKKFFGLGGVSVKAFPNPRHAVQWYKEHWKHIKLVFLDMENSSMSGEDCFRILQSINPGVQIALISGNVEVEIAEQLMQKGALRFFPKPFHYPTLIAWGLNRLGLAVKLRQPPWQSDTASEQGS